MKLPSLNGKTAIVTGGTSGLGFWTARGLVEMGASVIIASHNHKNGVEAVRKIKTVFPEARVTFSTLDLADKNSISNFAKTVKKVDILVCNAGIMMPAERQMTNYGVESQFGVNYLGHFMLVGLLLPMLKKSKGRVVTVSSMANNPAKFDLRDATGENKYHPFRLYALSKLSTLMFALELDKRSKQNSWGISAVPIHPGVVRTKLFSHSPHPFVVFSFIGTMVPILSMSARWAAKILLFAATSEKAKSGVFYGPLLTMIGGPRPAKPPKQALDPQKRNELWQLSEQITKVSI